MQHDIFAALDSPADNQHMILLYDNDDNRHAAVARFLNEGLRKGQLCIYGSVSYRDEDHLSAVKSLIIDSERHEAEGNLVYIDMAPIYIAAMQDDLRPFEQARDQFVKMVENRADKHIRFVGDCAGFLFKNKHFEECLMVEGWGQQKPFLGSYLCPYNKQLFETHPHNIHKKSVLLVKHELVIDAEDMTIFSSEELGAGHNNKEDREYSYPNGGLH